MRSSLRHLIHREPSATTRQVDARRRGDLPLASEIFPLANEIRRRRHEDRRRRSVGLLITTIIAGLAHVALVFPIFAAWLDFSSDDRPPAARVVSLDPSAWKANRELRDRLDRPEAPQQQRKPKAPPVPEQDEIPGQVVSIAPPLDDERPEHADYAAEYDSKTDRETVSRTQARMAANVTRKPQIGLDAPRDAPSAPLTVPKALANPLGTPGGPKGGGRAEQGETGTDKENGGGAPKLAMEIPGQEKQTGLDLDHGEDPGFVNREALRQLNSQHQRFRLAMGRMDGRLGDRVGAGQGDRQGQGMRGGAGTGGRPSLARLTPSLRDLERVTGAPANDWLPEVETDAETRLNAWRWKHSTFFNRVADGIRRTWAGPELLRREDPTGEVFGTQELFTVLSVTIDREGQLVEVMIQELSGADFLDDEAIRTFKDTAPYANPPLALFKGRDRFTFTFGFNVSYKKTEIDLNWRPY